VTSRAELARLDEALVRIIAKQGSFLELRHGEDRLLSPKPLPEGPGPPPEATEKPDRSGRGRDSEGARLYD
jgi:hypothetical protein